MKVIVQIVMMDDDDERLDELGVRALTPQEIATYLAQIDPEDVDDIRAELRWIS